MKFPFNGTVIGESILDVTAGVFNSKRHYDRKLDNDWETYAGEPPPGTDISTVSYSPTINIFTEPSTADSTAAYDVYDVQVDTSVTSSTGRIYIGCNVTATTTYYNDLCVGAVQVLNPSGTTRLYGYSFSNGTDVAGWNTSNAQTPLANADTAIEASNLAYTAIGSASTSRWGGTTSTGSSYTGAADGLSTAYGSAGNTILPTPGFFQVAQASSTNYLYRETSGSTLSTIVWLRSPLITVAPGSIIRVAAHSSTASGGGMTENNTLFIGWA